MSILDRVTFTARRLAAPSRFATVERPQETFAAPAALIGPAAGTAPGTAAPPPSLSPEASAAYAQAAFERMNRRLQAVAADVAGSGMGTDPILRLVRRLPGYGAEHDLKLFLFETLRETIPTLNAAILKRRYLEGATAITSDDPGLQTALRDWAESVPVQDFAQADFQTGLDTWLAFCSENADTYGLAFPELVLASAGGPGAIERLVSPHPRSFYWKTLEAWTGEGETRRVRLTYELHQKSKAGDQVVQGPFVKVLTFSNDPSSPWGRPVAWGLPFVAEILIRILVSLNNLWWRTGDPSTLYQIVYSQRADGTFPKTADVDADVMLLEDLVVGIFQERAKGKVADAFAGFSGGEVKSQAVGENIIVNSLAPYLRDHYQAVAGQIIANADVPSFMFPAGIVPADGLNSDKATVEAELGLRAARFRNVRRRRLAKFALDNFLIFERSAAFLGRYEVDFDQPRLKDPKADEDARLVRVQGDAAAIDNALLLRDTLVFETDEERDEYLVRNGVIQAASPSAR